MLRACCMIRDTSSYRLAAFQSGLKRCGYSITERYERRPDPSDLLLLWNRNRSHDPIAKIYEQAGATVLIAENGYIGTDDHGHKMYALARSNHNGAGYSPMPDHPRYEIPCKPWRKSGRHVLVMPQRGIGAPGVAMPHSWKTNIENRLKKITDRPVRIRRHPGAARTDPANDLVDCHCVVIWASGGGIKSLVAGVPVFHDFDRWIGRDAAMPLTDDLETCFTGDRGAMLRRITWAQWPTAQIESGEAFMKLINVEN